MKKAVLTILISFLMVNIVSACDMPPEAYKIYLERQFYDGIFLFSSVSMVLPIILFFLLSRKRLWILITAILTVVLSFPLGLLISIFTGSCGDGVSFYIRAEFLFMLFLFTFQVISWITQRSKLKTELP